MLNDSLDNIYPFLKKVNVDDYNQRIIDILKLNFEVKEEVLNCLLTNLYLYIDGKYVGYASVIFKSYGFELSEFTTSNGKHYNEFIIGENINYQLSKMDDFRYKGIGMTFLHYIFLNWAKEKGLKGFQIEAKDEAFPFYLKFFYLLEREGKVAIKSTSFYTIEGKIYN